MPLNGVCGLSRSAKAPLCRPSIAVVGRSLEMLLHFVCLAKLPALVALNAPAEEPLIKLALVLVLIVPLVLTL